MGILISSPGGSQPSKGFWGRAFKLFFFFNKKSFAVCSHVWMVSSLVTTEVFATPRANGGARAQDQPRAALLQVLS